MTSKMVSFVRTPSMGGINPPPSSVEVIRVQPVSKNPEIIQKMNVLRSVENKRMSC
jgi:hypothetical protein